ncbi:MAG: neutral/alkaline non-lysosomal ceramidase N-terminal domain-containing protein [Myxococcota bacterium]
MQRPLQLSTLALCLSLSLGCGDTPSVTPQGSDTATAHSDAGPDDAQPAEDDAAVHLSPAPLDASASDAGSDAVASPVDPTLYAGFATSPLRFPIGTATVGYGPRVGPKTPYAESYPGTTAQHTELRAKAMVLTQGDRALALVRTDTIGVWQDMVRDVQVRLRELGHPALADGLLVTATHTHRSGGRIFDHFIGEIAVGPFMPGFYPRVRDAIVDAVVTAKETAIPARLGHTTTQLATLHKDRRCENGDVQDDTVGLIKVEALDGTLLGGVVNYAMHGTMLSNSEFVLSTDAPGAVEDGLEAVLPGDPTVLYVQSWAGDMAPQTPSSHFEDHGDDLRTSYANLRAVAAEAAEKLAPAFNALNCEPELSVHVVTVAVPFNNDLINPDGSFEDYPFGGIYCMNSSQNCGPDAEPLQPSQLNCVGIPEEYTVSWTLMTAARVGGLVLVSLPGEPVTAVGTELRAKALEATGLDDVFVVGYAQSYLAYLLHPDDYFMGGYEGASALMGPGFGQYLINSGVAVARRLVEPDSALFAPPAEIEESTTPLSYDALSWEEAEGEAEIIEGPSLIDGVWTLTWSGGDPAVDEPLVAIERQGEDGQWDRATYANDKAIDSRGPEIELALETAPTYAEAMSLESRSFLWTARLPATFRVPAATSLTGRLRFIVTGTQPSAYTFTTAAFDR